MGKLQKLIASWLVLVLLLTSVPIPALGETLSAETTSTSVMESQSEQTEQTQQSQMTTDSTTSESAKNSSATEVTTSTPKNTIADPTIKEVSPRQENNFNVLEAEKEATPEISIDYQNEKLVGFDPKGRYRLNCKDMEYFVDNTSEFSINDYMMGNDYFGNNWTIKRLASDEGKQDSDYQRLRIPRRPIFTTSYITVKNESYKGSKDGQLIVSFETVKVEYRKKNTGEWTLISGGRVTGLEPGTYEVRYPFSDNSFVSLPDEFVIEEGLEKEEKPNVLIDYQNEKLINFDPQAEYRLKNGNETLIVKNITELIIKEGMMGLNYFGKDWRVVRLASGEGKQDSDAQIVNIPEQKSLLLNYVTPKDETYAGANDGKLRVNYSDKAVEYRKKETKEWKLVENQLVSNLSPGIYETRHPATDKDFATRVTEYEVKKGLEKEKAPNVSIDYQNEKIVGFDSTARYEMKWGKDTRLVENVTELTIEEGMMGLNYFGKSWRVVRLASGEGKQNSDIQTVTIPERQILQSHYITPKDETTPGANDGELRVNYSDKAVEYRKKDSKEWKLVKDQLVSNLSPGIYETRHPATDKDFATRVTEYEIKKGLEKEKAPDVSIDYQNEKIVGFDSTARYEMKWGKDTRLVENKSEYSITEDMMGESSYGKNWAIVRLASNEEKQNSDSQSLKIPERGIISSNHITVIDETYAGANDGQLQMNDDTLAVEYRKKGTKEWIPVEESVVTGLESGIYEARHPASATSFASKIREYEIKKGPLKKDSLKVNPKELNLTAPLGYTSNSLRNEITITNIGSEAINGLMVKGSTTKDFKLKNNAATKLAAGQSTTFTIEPNAGLTAGIYKMNVEIISNNAAPVTLPVTFEVFAQGSVVVRYQDDMKNEIANPEKLSGKVGDSYTTKVKKIDGYTFKEVLGSTSGSFSDQEQTVTYIYQKAGTSANMSIHQPKDTGNGQRGSVTSKKELLKAGETTNNLIALSGLIVLGFALVLYLRKKYPRSEISNN